VAAASRGWMSCGRILPSNGPKLHMLLGLSFDIFNSICLDLSFLVLSFFLYGVKIRYLLY